MPDGAAAGAQAEQVLGLLAARKKMFAQRRPNIICMVPLSAVRRLLDGGVAPGLPTSDRARRICRQLAEAEVNNMISLMETEPMGLQFGVLAGSEPTSFFQILRARDRVTLAINPFRPDAMPNAQTGVAMITDLRRSGCRPSACGRGVVARRAEGRGGCIAAAPTAVALRELNPALAVLFARHERCRSPAAPSRPVRRIG